MGGMYNQGFIPNLEIIWNINKIILLGEVRHRRINFKKNSENSTIHSNSHRHSVSSSFL
jgi:hypothetical protein